MNFSPLQIQIISYLKDAMERDRLKETRVERYTSAAKKKKIQFR